MQKKSYLCTNFSRKTTHINKIRCKISEKFAYLQKKVYLCTIFVQIVQEKAKMLNV